MTTNIVDKINSKNKDFMLYSACIQENLELVDTLLNLGANPTTYYVGKKGTIKLLKRLL